MARIKKSTVNIVIPVYNEQEELDASIATLSSFCREQLQQFDWKITIVDNASTDQTLRIAKDIASHNPAVSAVHLDKKGRGRAVKYVWRKYTADINVYMDVDLSTDLKHLPSLIGSLSRGFDVAIGTRNAWGARVQGRSLLRTITSKTYIFLIKLSFWVHFSDAQCGFKAVSRRIVAELLPRIVDDEWFFDTELLVISERKGYRIYEEPVTWVDNPGSTVRVMKTAQGDLRGLWRLFLTKPWERI